MAYSVAMKAIVKRRTREAAELIASAARARSSFSTRIPASVRVTMLKGDEAALIVAGGPQAPNAYPFEEGKDHPLFGNRNFWYPTPKRPFMTEASELAANEAAMVMARVIDDAVNVLGL